MPSSAVSPREAALSLGLDPDHLPRHVAIIMDGNGRWAAARGLPRAAGHKAGVDAVRKIVRLCGELGIEALTLYAFSTENWLRPKAEVSDLMRLLSWVLRSETLDLDKHNVRLRVIGRVSELPLPVQKDLARAREALADNTGLVLNLALNYGARAELVDAFNALRGRGAETITEEDVSGALYTAGLPDPDLVIRTSGESRLSNFLLWQLAYAEIYVTPAFWPDFGRDAFAAALKDFQGRARRFGGI